MSSTCYSSQIVMRLEFSLDRFSKVLVTTSDIDNELLGSHESRAIS